MKPFLLVCAIVLALVFPRETRAQAASAGAIESVISDQIAAFVARDAEAAFAYASPMIREMFRDARVFARMVEQGYPMVWTPTETRFLGLRSDGDGVWQRVLLRDQTGGYHLLDYKMVELEAGWRIDGVVLIRPAGVGA